MAEINEIHNLSLEWGAVLNLATRIADIEEKIGPWDDLANLVASLLDNHRTSSPEALAKNVYPYLFRLYFRLKSYSKPSPFNKISLASRAVPMSDNAQYTDEQEGYLISNYDFKTYTWAKELQLDDFISNNELWVPKGRLTSAQIQRFDKLALNNEL